MVALMVVPIYLVETIFIYLSKKFIYHKFIINEFKIRHLLISKTKSINKLKHSTISLLTVIVIYF